MSSRADVLGAAPSAERPTEERLLDAAEHCIGRFGLGRLSMHDVAQQAGLSRSTVYLHFADRAALIDAVLARAATRFVASSEAAVRRRRTLAGQVGEAAVFILAHRTDEIFTVRSPAEGESLLAVLLAAQAERLVTAWVAFWRPFLDDAVARGEVRPGLDIAQAGEWIVRMLLSFAVMPAATFDVDDPEAVREFVRQHLVQGLAP
ncbi:MAG TPA: helix-turn-helix domain-containing protein [Acidimicrobiales bacterium]|nr:helix-turn-helix domain-containing protein [Acidimicrobiales bacterium]